MRYYEHWEGKEQTLKQLTQEDKALLKDALEKVEDALVLDVGCGYGRIMNILRRQGFQVVGLDVSKNLLRKAKRISDVILGSLTHIPFKDKAFDVCLCMWGPLNHVPSLSEGLREIRRVCKWRVIASCYNAFYRSLLFNPLKYYPKIRNNPYRFFSNALRLIREINKDGLVVRTASYKAYHPKQLIKDSKSVV